MPSRTTALVNPRMLAWPRTAIGMPLSIAAAKIGVSEDRLHAFESGDARPTVRQLRAIAKTYRRPTAFFYLEELPTPPEPVQDFRTLPDEHDPSLPELLDAVEAAREKRRVAIELSRLLDQEPAAFGIAATLDEDPSVIAGRLRDRLAVGLPEQRTWREKYVVLRKWIAAVERAGVLVTQFSGVEVQAARGFSIFETPLPVIALNGKDSPRARVFTLFHELAHITLGSTGLCDLRDDAFRQHAIERFCNSIAAETLVPSQNLLTEPLVTGHHELVWEDWRLRELARSYGVSNEVILRRLLTLHRTTEDFYQKKRAEYLEAYEEARAAGGGFLEYYRRVLRDNGIAVTRLVLDAYRADLVTPTEVSRHLGGVKLTHLSRIEEAVRTQGP